MAVRLEGQRNMYVVGAYKKNLLNRLKLNKDFQLALLGKELDSSTPIKEKTILNQSFKECVFDHAFVPGTTTEEHIFVCMEITCPYADAITWKDLYIHVYVFTPKMSVQWETDCELETKSTLESRGYIGNKIDMVIDIIDRELNGLKHEALGSIKLAPREGMQIFSYVDGYYGKQLTYMATDFNLLPSDVLKLDYENGEL